MQGTAAGTTAAGAVDRQLLYNVQLHMNLLAD